MIIFLVKTENLDWKSKTSYLLLRELHIHKKKQFDCLDNFIEY